MFDIPLVAMVALAGASLGLIVWTLVSQVNDRSAARNSLRALEQYEVENVRDQELLDPLRDRALAPILGFLTSIGRRLTPIGYVDGVRQKFVQAGRPASQSVDRFLAMRVMTVVAIPFVIFFFFFWNPLGYEGNTRLGLAGLLLLVLAVGPDARLNREVEARQTSILRGLPDIMDLLVISVEAGLGFEQALQRVTESVEGPLPDEFARMLGEVRAGSTRAEAMRAMDARIEVAEVRSFVLAILQADAFGVSIGRVLRSQADEMRIKRRQLAEEKAQMAPVKMLIPMVFCIFPALFTIVLGPAAIRITQAF